MRKIADSGERMIPEFHHDALMYAEHVVRYLFACRFVRGKRVLDLASGVGYGSDMLRAAGAVQVIGLDRSKEAVVYGREHHAAFQPDYLLADAESLPLGDGQFHVVVSFETLEHVVDYHRFLQEAKRVMHPGGLLILSTPNKGIYMEGNLFHTKEFAFSELEDDLTTRFKHVRILAQDNWITSAILAPSMMERADTQIAGDVKVYKTTGKPATETQYMVSLCSDAPLPKAGQQVAVTDLYEMRRYVDEIARLNADIDALKADLAERDALLVEKEATLAQKDTALADRDRLVTNLEAALAERESLLAQREASLQQATQELIATRQSLGYRILEVYRRPIRWLFPADSRRGLPYRALRRAVKWLLDRRPVRSS